MIGISVIIPVYNTEEYIVECIESVLENNYTDYEIICINDGSTDSSLELINNLAKTYDCIKVVSQENKGLSATRNKAIQLAKGKYIYFLDSDDKISSDALENFWKYLENDNLDVLYFSGDSFFEKQELEEQFEWFITAYLRKGKYEQYSSGLALLKDLREQGDYSVSACTQIVRREFLIQNDIKFYEGIIHEDNLFTFQVLYNAKRARCVNDIYFYRRVREDSIMTTQKTYKNLLGYYTCFINVLNCIRGEKIDKEYENAISGVLRSLKYNIQKSYFTIEKEQREFFYDLLNADDRIFFKSVILQEMEREVKLKREIKRVRKQLYRLEESTMLKVGKFITWPGRKVKSSILAIKHCGWRYIFSTIYRKINKNKICVSIIIPVYNAEKHLEECLVSIQKQSLKNIEVICVNDGSTDNSLKILKRFSEQDKRFKVIDKKNTGAGDSRNIGMQYAKGEYLLFLDADDVFDKELCYKAYRRAKIDDADICFVGAERINMRTNQKEYMGWVLRSTLLPQQIPFKKEDIGDQYFQLASACPWSKLFRREFIMQYQIEFQNLRNSNDVFFVRTAMALANSLTYVNEKLVIYRFAEGSNTQSNKKENPLEFYKAYKALKENLLEKGVYKSLEKSFVNMVFDDCMFNYRTTTTEEAKKIIIDKLRNEGIEFFEFNKYPQDYFENRTNIKEFKEIVGIDFR